MWAVWWWVPPVLNVVLGLASVILIGLVLLQKGKGGGLTGALGGMGGSSAFGSRAGDLFTRITIYTALVWILLIMIAIKTTQPPEDLKQPSTIQTPDSGGAPVD
jgi:preprotein translocase subunit SecG